jgi:hypothetical protein
MVGIVAAHDIHESVADERRDGIEIMYWTIACMSVPLQE